MTATKPPPRFVTSHAAWEYTLAKLAAKDKLDDGGNPTNYAAASAIYKAVAKKYGESLMLELPPVLDADDRKPFIRRDQALAMSARSWNVSHNAAWSVGTDDAYQRLYFRPVLRVARDGNREVLEPLFRFEIERHSDAGTHSHTVDYDLAWWLVRESQPGTLFVQERLEDAFQHVQSTIAEVKSLAKGTDVGQVADFRFDPQFFDADATLAMLRQAQHELDDAINAGPA